MLLITKHVFLENGMTMLPVKSGFDEDLWKVLLHIHLVWSIHLEITHHQHHLSGHQLLLSRQEYLHGKISCQAGHRLIMKSVLSSLKASKCTACQSFRLLFNARS